VFFATPAKSWELTTFDSAVIISQTVMSKCRHFVWTLNNYTAEHVQLARSIVDRGMAEYVAFQPERGGVAGTPHLQGVVSFKHPQGVKGCADRLPGRPHVEPMRGNMDQAVAYAHKVCTLAKNPCRGTRKITLPTFPPNSGGFQGPCSS